MADIFIKKLNHVYAQVQCDPGIAMELAEHFTYFVDGYAWSPKFRYGNWDGKIREFNKSNNTIRAGLYQQLKQFAKAREYDFQDDGSFGYSEFSVAEAEQFIKTLDLPPPYNEVRDYQVKAFVGAVREGRSIRISPTASGKSLIIYLLCRYYSDKTLIIVPTKGLVAQMASDFSDYGYKYNIHQIQGGVAKHSDSKFTISTWQSLYKEPKSYFDQYKVIIGDEVHGFAANSLKGIMDKAYNAAHRHGFTGTLADSKTNEMCLEGMFGKIHQVVTTSELMEQGHVAQLKIKGLILKYPDHVRKKMKRVKYPDEVKFLVTCEARNRFIKNLVLSLPQNTMVMFHHIEHGKYMFEQVKKETNRPVYYIAGGTDTEERERVRKILEVEDNAIIFGSRGTMSTGSNTKSLHNIIFASPTKSKIQTLQSIGRGLRKTELKTKVTLFDIADDLHCPGWTNYVLSHFKERVKIYLSESFDFKLYEIDLVVKQE